MVAADEKETSGLRALLNLGHTFGRIEAHMGYGVWLHVKLSRLAWLWQQKQQNYLVNLEQTQRVVTLLERITSVKGPSQMKPDDYLPHMMQR